MAVEISAVPELLRPLWQERAPRILERIVTVERALRQQSDSEREEGLRQAHKLHGLLGTFGFQEGSRVAGVAEELLEANDSSRAGWAAAADACEHLLQELTVLVNQSNEDGESEE